MFHQIKILDKVLLLPDVHLILVDSTQLDTELENQDLLHHKI